MRFEKIDLFEEPQILPRGGFEVALDGGDEGVRSVPMGDAFERALLQLIDQEVALGIAQRLLRAVVGQKRCELTIIAIQRRLPNEKLAAVAFFRRGGR